MVKWVKHNDTLFNLDHYNIVVRGDDDEIILSTETSNEIDWDDESKCASLRFKDRDQREKAFETICSYLDCLI